MLQELVAVEGDSVGDTPESCFSEPELWLRSMWPPGGSVGQRVPCPGIANQMIALGFLLFSFFPSFLLFLHYPLQPGAPNLNKLQVASISCSVNLWKGLFFPWCNVLRKFSEEWEQNFFAGGCRVRGDAVSLLGSRRFFLIPNHIYLSFLYLLTVQNVIWKKKKN